MQASVRFSRRAFLHLSNSAVVGLAASCSASASRADAPAPQPGATDRPRPDEVLRLLLEGNQRFVRGELSHPGRKPADFAPLAESQSPRAVIVGCADSRVAPEVLFDQGIGDLFVVRIAGNVISGAGAIVKGSIEYAVAELDAPLVLVLGHSKCGAVKAAQKHIDAKDSLPGAINDLVALLKPAVAQAKGKPGDPLDNAIRANVEIGVERLRSLEPVVARAVKQGRTKVAGAVYDLATGKVALVA